MGVLIRSSYWLTRPSVASVCTLGLRQAWKHFHFFSGVTELSLVPSLSIAVPRWLRGDTADSVQVSCGVWFKRAPTEPHWLVFVPTSRFYISINIGLNSPKTSLWTSSFKHPLLISEPSNKLGSAGCSVQGGRRRVFCSCCSTHLLSTCCLQTVLIFMCSLYIVFN